MTNEQAFEIAKLKIQGRLLTASGRLQGMTAHNELRRYLATEPLYSAVHFESVLLDLRVEETSIEEELKAALLNGVLYPP